MLKIELRPSFVIYTAHNRAKRERERDRGDLERQSSFWWLSKAKLSFETTAYTGTNLQALVHTNTHEHCTQNSKAINIKLENIEIANKVCNVTERVSFVPSTGAVQTD